MKRNKRIFSLFLALTMTLSLLTASFGATSVAGLSNFTKSKAACPFTDLAGWYADYAREAYAYGLMRGVNETTFRADGTVTLAETVALAARLHSIYYQDNADLTQGSPWYQVYVSYARASGILPQNEAYGGDYTRPATRAQFAQILAKALPDNALNQINAVEIGAIPDVDMDSDYALSVYKLYRAGIVVGADNAGTFLPGSTIRRSEVATIAVRMAAAARRQSITLYAPLYVGFSVDSANQGAVSIKKLTMTTDGTNATLTIEFNTQTCKFLSLMNETESAYMLRAATVEVDADSVTFSFPMVTLEKLYIAATDPKTDRLMLEFYATGDPDSVTDRFYITLHQFEKYFVA